MPKSDLETDQRELISAEIGGQIGIRSQRRSDSLISGFDGESEHEKVFVVTGLWKLVKQSLLS